MTIKEKARAYDKAIEKIKYVMEHGVSPTLSKEDLEDIFTELAESEDERIRKAIAYCIMQGFIGYGEIENVTVDACLAWLEKQGQKPQVITNSEDERIREAQLDYWRSVGGKEWHGVPVQETIAWLEKQGEQKWSEEDDRIHYSLLADIKARQKDSTNTLEAYYNEQIDWLKSLKKRMEE